MDLVSVMETHDERSEEPIAKPPFGERDCHARAGDDNHSSVTSNHSIAEAKWLIGFSGKGKTIFLRMR